MYVQKQKELQKQYDKQEKKLKELKAGGKSTKQAVSMDAAQPATTPTIESTLVECCLILVCSRALGTYTIQFED